MGLNATARRRWFGGLVLAAALVMLVAGETVLKGRLGAQGFLLYWLVCFVLTTVAIFVALLDVRALARRTLREQHELFDATLLQIQKEVREGGSKPEGRSSKESRSSKPDNGGRRGEG